MRDLLQGEWVACLLIQAERNRLAAVLSLFRDACCLHAGVVSPVPDLEEGLWAFFRRAEEAVAAVDRIRKLLREAPDTTSLSDQLRSAIALGQLHDHDPWAPGSAFERAAGLAAITHAGQTLLSEEVATLVEQSLPVGARMLPLGRHRLKDLRSTVMVVQLIDADGPESFPPLRSLDVVPNNLPVQMTSFVGRRKAVAEVAQQMRNARLVTLTGPGGSGKTRLALQVGAESLDQFPDGVWMVDLSNLSDPDLVAPTIAAALGIPEAPGRRDVETLCAALGSRRLLILLDNCEHLILACARLVQSLLAESPLLQVLATSREPLGIAGETAWLTPTLSVPDESVPPAPIELLRSEAVKLFVERARAVLPSFTVTEQNAAALAKVCRRLDGVPLAIELAASRCRVLSVEQIAERLDDRLRLLTAGTRDALQRHQTLRAAIDWSYELLSAAERVLWRRLAVFPGGFSLAAVESICAGGPIDSLDLLDLLAQLVDKSLVVAEEINGEKRYRLLETVRQYGRDLLQESGEEGALRRAHCIWCLGQVEPLEPGRWLAAHQIRLKIDHDNLRQAVQWALENRETELALRLCGGLWYYWFLWGDVNEHWEKLVQMSEVEPGPESLEAKGEVLLGTGAFAFHRGEASLADHYQQRALAFGREHQLPKIIASALHNLSLVPRAQGRFDLAQQYLEEALRVSQGAGDKLRTAWFVTTLGGIALEVGDYEVARRYAEEGLVLQRELSHEVGIALVMEILGLAALETGEFETAGRYLEDALGIRRSVSDKGEAVDALLGLSQLAFARGELEEAHRLHMETLRTFWEMGEIHGVAYALEGISWLAAAAGEHEVALRLAGGCDGLLRQSGYVSPPRRARITAKWLSGSREALGVERSEAVLRAGSQLTQQELIELAASVQPRAVTPTPAAQPEPKRESPRPFGLTEREFTIVQFVAQGLTAKEIGQRLYLSFRTVEKHEENIRMKLGVNNRAALIAWAVRNG